MDLSCKIGSTGLVAIGTIVGAITLNPIVLGVILGSGLILNTFTEAKSYKRKIEISKFAYTTHEKILIDLRSYLRGVKFNEAQFFTEIRLIDQMITNLCPSVLIRFALKYNKKFIVQSTNKAYSNIPISLFGFSNWNNKFQIPIFEKLVYYKFD